MHRLNSLNIPYVGAAEKAAISKFIEDHLQDLFVQDVSVEVHAPKGNPDSCKKIDIVILFKNNN